MEEVLNLDLASTTEKLFVNAEEGFKNVQAKIELDVTDMDNPKLIAKKGSNTLTLYGYTNKATFNGKDIVLKGETIFTLIKGVYNLKDVYVPQDAIKLLEIMGYPESTVRAARESAERFERKGSWGTTAEQAS
jgi:alkaline phosphatase